MEEGPCGHSPFTFHAERLTTSISPGMKRSSRLRTGSEMQLRSPNGEALGLLDGEVRGSIMENFVLLNWDKGGFASAEELNNANKDDHDCTSSSENRVDQSVGASIDSESGGVKGTVLLTSYRLMFIDEKRSQCLCQFPVQAVEKIVKQKNVYEFLLKDFRIVNLMMEETRKSNEENEAIRKHAYFIFLSRVALKPNTKVFAFLSKEKPQFVSQSEREQWGWSGYDIKKEYKRIGIPNERVRLTHANVDFELCETYPRILAVASYLTDSQLPKLVSFRSRKRFPTVSWYCRRTGAVILRSSQPLVGVTRTRNKGDEALLHTLSQHKSFESSISAFKSGSNTSVNDGVAGADEYVAAQTDAAGPESKAGSVSSIESAGSDTAVKLVKSGTNINTSTPEWGRRKIVHLLARKSVDNGVSKSGDSAETKALYILDARPLVNAGAMTLMGAGYEMIDHYKNCKLEFLGIENIHQMRKSMHRLRSLICKSDPDAVWLPDLYATRWLDHIGQLLGSASKGVQLVSEGHSILVHCSDGWDRTPQITALTMLMMDSYYRTMLGFITLIEKEWLSFGHKFDDRCMLGSANDRKEFSPVFLQFLDCTWQILQQYPRAFEFNERMLIFIMDSVYSCRFGTFLGNCEKDRQDIRKSTPCLWDRIGADRDLYINPQYKPNSNKRPLQPTNSQRFLRLWPGYYHRYYYLLPTCESDHVDREAKTKFSSHKGNITTNITKANKQRRPMTPFSPNTQRSSLVSVLREQLQLEDPLKSLPVEDLDEELIETESADSADEDDEEDDISNELHMDQADKDEGVDKGLDAPFPVDFPQAPVKWMPDDQVSNCSLCQKRFSAMRRKHHCRRCGHIFCNTCAHYRRLIPHISSKPVRVCNNCFLETTQ
eukprot:CFRG6442T1